jgi:hypothetical protein
VQRDLQSPGLQQRPANGHAHAPDDSSQGLHIGEASQVSSSSLSRAENTGAKMGRCGLSRTRTSVLMASTTTPSYST